MNPIKNLKTKINSKPVGEKFLSDSHFRAMTIALLSMGCNILYSILYGVMAYIYSSFWFLTMFAYYLILGLLRLSVAVFGRSRKNIERKMTVCIGLGLIFIAVILAGSVTINFHSSVTVKYDQILMITIATYTFVLAFLAVRNVVLAHKQKSAQMIALRNISLASATASMLSLQRSMITTFGNGESYFRYLMEGSMGLFAFLVVLALGFSMILKRKNNDK